MLLKTIVLWNFFFETIKSAARGSLVHPPPHLAHFGYLGVTCWLMVRRQAGFLIPAQLCDPSGLGGGPLKVGQAVHMAKHPTRLLGY
jgi:hypothetical protein